MIWLNVPLKDITMERVRVEKSGETKMKIVDGSILFFFRVYLSKFSLETIFNTWVLGVFILVCV